METKLGAGPCALAEEPQASEKPADRPSRSPKVLLTSVCRPLGPAHGDAPSVGYEVLHGQVTRAQGVFSPRSVNFTYGLDYIAANLDAPAVVLQYPSHRELIRELKKGPDYVGVSFNLVLFHRMKEVVALVRKHAPRAKIVLGGYGTVLDDATLAPYGDYFCRGEGVAFFRALLNEPPRPMPYDHPLVMLSLKVFSMPMDRTGVIFAGLGCPNGCDFCCTSHYFKRRHIRLLPTGDDIFRVVERYLEVDPHMSMAILDEDFLLAKDRATRMRELVLARGTPLSIFAFASVKALSRFTPQELLETGVDGVWVGYEGKRSGYAKQQGKPIEELIPELRSHGITVLSSMILGFEYHTPEIIREEMAEFLALRPTYGQFLIYGPTPGTPFYERVMQEGRLRPEMLADPERYYRNCDGFTSMVVHPTMKPGEIEALQRECFDTDFRAQWTFHPAIGGGLVPGLEALPRFRFPLPARQSGALGGGDSFRLAAFPRGQALRPDAGSRGAVGSGDSSCHRPALFGPAPAFVAGARRGRLDRLHPAPQFVPTPQAGPQCLSHHSLGVAFRRTRFAARQPGARLAQHAGENRRRPGPRQRPTPGRRHPRPSAQ